MFSRDARRSANDQAARRFHMKRTAQAIWIAVMLSILGLGCGSSSTGKNLYKDKDKPQPAEKEK
jgi:hypothetical protein